MVVFFRYQFFFFHQRVLNIQSLVVSKLDSQSKGCGFESRLIKNTRWKWVKAMLGSIPAPNSGSFMEKIRKDK